MNKINMFLFAILMSGCVEISQKTPQNETIKSQSKQNQEILDTKTTSKPIESSFYNTKISDKGHNLLELMEGYLGKKDGGDCSGFVSLINKNFNNTFFSEKQLSKYYTKHGLKSEAMFKLYESKNLITKTNPEIGDLIFFNNTTKKTKNNKKSKIITHVGIISSIEKDGRIGFTHNTRGRNTVHYMNLNDKNTHKNGKKEINSYIVVCKNKSISCLTSNRFSGFGKANIK